MRQNNFKRVKIGDLLVMRNMITDEQLREAIEYQKSEGVKVGKALIKLGYLKEKDLLEIYAEGMRIEVKTYDEIEPTIDGFAVDMISEELIRKYKIFPVKSEGNEITVLVNDPYNIELEEEIKLSINKELKMILAQEQDIERFISQRFDRGEDTTSLEEFEGDDDSNYTDKYDVTNNENMSTIVKLVNKIVEDAYLMRASDIHIEPTEDSLIVRHRIDGVLFLLRKLPKNVHQPLTARLKMMANLDISERRKPQDGRIQLGIQKKDVDARIAVMPTINGEKTTIRILDRGNVLTDITKLGLSDEQMVKFKRMVSQPTGIVLVTGPTGSGKTSTLYTVLSEVNEIDKNIVTVEDPVEYKLAGINQTSINEKAGITFAKALKAFMRQDPDIIMIGEIRDNETADIAAKAATTGHKVYATLHTDRACDALGRLLNMDVPNYLLATTISGVISQRLIRRVCEHCKVEKALEEDDLNRMFFDLEVGEKYIEATGKLPDGRECNECKGIGYKGRLPIHEVLEMDYELRKIVSEKGYDYSFEEKARERGMITLREDALGKAKKGLTTLSEVRKIVES